MQETYKMENRVPGGSGKAREALISMPYGGSRSRSEWVTPKISGGKTKVFLVESWYNSTLALPYQLSHATKYCGTGESGQPRRLL
ncbi:MAG: hypothetical protein IJL36_07530 [Clostridia bacterium]|nr:hypothetical protein [Clostridia bacterium]